MCQEAFAQLISSVLCESVCGEVGRGQQNVRWNLSLRPLPTLTLYPSVTAILARPSAGMHKSDMFNIIPLPNNISIFLCDAFIEQVRKDNKHLVPHLWVICGSSWRDRY